MKKSLLFNLFGLILSGVFFGCSEDINTDFGPYVDPNGQTLTVAQKSVTSSTFTYSVEATDPDIPYLALYIDKAVIDDVAKTDLPEYVMKEMQSAAKASGKSFEEYLESVSIKGNTEKTINNLLPGSLYELVVLPYSGTKSAKKAETLFFETAKADKIDCSFNAEAANIQQTTVSLNVVPSNKDTEWYVAVLNKQGYEAAKAVYTDEYIIQSVFAQEFEYILAQLAEGDINKVTDKLINETLDQMFYKGDQSLKLSNLTSNSEYVCLLAAYNRVLLSDYTEAVLVSDAGNTEFATIPYEFNDVTFDVEANIHDGVRADISVKPSDKTLTYAFYYDSFNETNKDYDNIQMAEMWVKQNANFPSFMWANYKGDISLPDVGVTPGSKNFVLAFTYNNGITSNPELYVYDVPAAGNPEDMEITYKDVNSTAYNVSLKSEVSDNTILYASIIVDADKYNEAEYKALMEANIAYEFQMNSQYNPSLTMESFLYNNDYYRPGNKELQFQGMNPSSDYIVVSMAINTSGKVVKAITQEVSTKALSDATVVDKIEGIFNGNDAADIFNDESARGRAVVAIRFAPGANSKDVTCGVAMDNDRITDSKDDYFILTGYNVPWKQVGKSGLSFVKCDWNNKYYSFSYAKDEEGVEGVMKRTYIDNITTSNVGTKEELQALYDETVAESEEFRNSVSLKENTESKYIKAKVISVEGGINPNQIKAERVSLDVLKENNMSDTYVSNGKFSSVRLAK